MNEASPLLLIVSSPSGAGKTTLCHKLLAEFDDLKFSISHTTRKPRPEEVNGQDYHFVDEKQFNKMVENKMFVEWARVHGNRYGTACTEVSAAATSSKDLIFDVDFQGARQIKEQYPGAVGVFVLPPSIEELQRRLKARGTESVESLERRFKAALEEIAQHDILDYLLVNDDLEIAYDFLKAILMAERSKHERNVYLAKEMLEV